MESHDPQTHPVADQEARNAHPETPAKKGKPLPASPAFDIEVVDIDTSKDSVSTHSFCTTCSA